MSIKKTSKPQSACNCTNMRRASRAITHCYDQLLEPSGLKITQYSLLNHLRRLGPLTMNELSKAIRLERTTLVRNLKPLEKRGLVGILADKTSQANQVFITDSGLKQLEEAAPYWEQAQNCINDLFTEEERRIFLGALQKIESLAP